MNKKYIRMVCFQIFIFVVCLLLVLFWKAVSRLDSAVLLPAASSLSMLPKVDVSLTESRAHGEVSPNPTPKIIKESSFEHFAPQSPELVVSTSVPFSAHPSATRENLWPVLSTTTVNTTANATTSAPVTVATVSNFLRTGASAGFGGGGEVTEIVSNVDIQPSEESTVGSSGGSSGGVEVSDVVCPK